MAAPPSRSLGAEASKAGQPDFATPTWSGSECWRPAVGNLDGSGWPLKPDMWPDYRDGYASDGPGDGSGTGLWDPLG